VVGLFDHLLTIQSQRVHLSLERLGKVAQLLPKLLVLIIDVMRNLRQVPKGLGDLRESPAVSADVSNLISTRAADSYLKRGCIAEIRLNFLPGRAVLLARSLVYVSSPQLP
jgi:hypothetical protein